jgi:hypothetical protein
MKMELTVENYRTPESAKAFFSASQCRGLLKCPARELAIMNGTFEEEGDKDWALIGTYVDLSLLTPSRLPAWKEKHAADMVSEKTKKPYAWVALADAMISRAISDALFMRTLHAETQRIITFELFGYPWKAALDICDVTNNYIADLKTSADFDDVWNEEAKTRLPWYDYTYLQLAVYREAYKSATENYPDACVLSAISKHKSFPGLQIVAFDDRHTPRFDSELEIVKVHIDDWAAMKAGTMIPLACKSHDCDFCRSTRVLTEEDIVTARNWKTEKRMSREF